jgi:hypothetical protein
MSLGKYASRLFGPGEQILPFEKRHAEAAGHVLFSGDGRDRLLF